MLFRSENTVFAIFENPDTSLIITSIVTIVPIAIATMMEHIGDIAAISSTVNRNYFENPGLHRTLFGDGLATLVASLFGAPANTTYGGKKRITFFTPKTFTRTASRKYKAAEQATPRHA